MRVSVISNCNWVAQCRRHVQLKQGRCVSSYSPNVSEPKGNYDAVIVGAGHNGLVAAAYLAKSGASVCVLERRHIVGGLAVTEEIVPGFKFSRASYVLSLLRPQIIEDLELKKHGLKIYLRNPSSYTPLRRSAWKDGEARSLSLGSDEKENFRQISQFSKKDAKAYIKYEKDLLRLVKAIDPLIDLSATDMLALLSAPSNWQKLRTLWKNPQLRRAGSQLSALGIDLAKLYEFLTAPAARLLEKRFESEPLKATLATDAVIGANITPHTPGSGYVLLHHVMGELEGIRGAWGYPEGGMGAVTQAMAKSAVSQSAHIFTEAIVSKIMVDNSGRATGVKMDCGREISAKIVLSNATPQRTLDLLPNTEALTESLGSVDYTSPVTKINVALNTIPNFLADPNTSEGHVMPHHRATIHMNCEHMGLITEAHDEASRGRISRRPMIEMVLPSSLDPTLCAAGSHVCLLFTQYTPLQLQGGHVWDQLARKTYADAVFDSIEEYAPGFKSSIVGYELLSPPDLEETFGLTGGNIFHGAMSPDRLFFCRPAPGALVSPMTHVDGLLLCGAGAHPGGGVMGVPGRIAAEAAIARLAK